MSLYSGALVAAVLAVGFVATLAVTLVVRSAEPVDEVALAAPPEELATPPEEGSGEGL